jgi:SAM-dependent methyltransferase
VTNEKRHLEIVRACEEDLHKYGDNFRGVGWTKKPEYADLRYRVMLDLLRDREPATLLDIGCGTSMLNGYRLAQGMDHVTYSGLDLSPAYLQVSRDKYPGTTFYEADILEADTVLPVHDYVVMNGLFNFKGSMSFDQMWDYMRKMLVRADQLSTRGFAFNVMSKYLDWERDDLFHLPFDQLAGFLDKNISRHFTMRHDYALFEYTTYVYKVPTGAVPTGAEG